MLRRVAAAEHHCQQRRRRSADPALPDILFRLLQTELTEPSQGTEADEEGGLPAEEQTQEEQTERGEDSQPTAEEQEGEITGKEQRKTTRRQVAM